MAAAAIERRLEQIRTGDPAAFLTACWEAHGPVGAAGGGPGESCHGVRWTLLPLEDLCSIARCLGGGALAAICLLFSQGVCVCVFTVLYGRYSL
eukprot:1190873-Prorocentrum_minimum.AAC.1